MIPSQTTLLAILAALTTTTLARPQPHPSLTTMTRNLRLQGRSDGPDASNISCGCDDFSDALITDCQAAIDQVDVTMNDATDPMNAIDTVHAGPLGSYSIQYRSGGCSIGAGNTQTINGPGGVGGGVSGTALSGQVVHDVTQVSLLSISEGSEGVCGVADGW